MINNKPQDISVAVDHYMLLKKQNVYKHQQLDIKRQQRNHAIFQGFWALSCVALGRTSFVQNNPVAFLFCLACAKGAIESHTKALSQYLTARQKLNSLNNV